MQFILLPLIQHSKFTLELEIGSFSNSECINVLVKLFPTVQYFKTKDQWAFISFFVHCSCNI